MPWKIFQRRNTGNNQLLIQEGGLCLQNLLRKVAAVAQTVSTQVFVSISICFSVSRLAM